MKQGTLYLIVMITISLLSLGIVLTVCYATVSGKPIHESGFQTLKEWGLVIIGGLMGFIAPFRMAGDSKAVDKSTISA